MGGYGSGERWRSKPKTDAALRLDVRWLARQGLFGPGRSCWTPLYWTCNGKPSGDIRVRYNARRPDELVLDYRTRVAGETEWTDVQEIVRLERTPCRPQQSPRSGRTGTGKRGSARPPADVGSSPAWSLRRPGTATDHGHLSKHNKALLVRAGPQDQRFHDPRHTAATLMLRDGLPRHEVSAVLGYSQTSTALNVYLHVLPGANDRAAAAMERLLG